MEHTYVLLAVLLMGLLSLHHTAHALFCSPSDPVGHARISQEMCANLSVVYTWTASGYVEAEIEINCSNETHETGPIESYERTYSNGREVTTQVSPELEGNVQCVIRGCYEDNDFNIHSIAPVTVNCVSTGDEEPSPTPTPSFTTQLPLSSSRMDESSSALLASNSEDVNLSPTPSPVESTQNSRPLDPIFLYSVITAAVLVFTITIIIAVLIVIKMANGDTAKRGYYLKKIPDYDNEVNMDHKFKQLNGPMYGSISTVFDYPEVVEEPPTEYPEVVEQVIIAESDSSNEPIAESENTGDEEGSASSQAHIPSIEHFQASNCSTPGGYVPDISVACGDSGAPVPTSDPDTVDFPDDIESNLSEDRRSPSPAFSSELVCTTGNSKNRVENLDVGTRESVGYYSQKEDQLHSDMEPDSTQLCAIGQEFLDLEAFREGTGCSVYPTSGSGNSTDTSGRGYIYLPSSGHLGTED